jgi:hypothetical protein
MNKKLRRRNNLAKSKRNWETKLVDLKLRSEIRYSDKSTESYTITKLKIYTFEDLSRLLLLEGSSHILAVK